MKQTKIFLLGAALCGVLYMPIACSNNGSTNGDGDAGDGDGDGDVSGGQGGSIGDGDVSTGGSIGGGDGDGDLGTGGGNVVTCDGEGTDCEDGSNCCSGYCDPTSSKCSCASAGEDCLGGGDCCSGQCNTLTNTCALILGTCLQAETPCESGAECCTLSCVDGLCSDTQCIEDNATCSDNGECCSGQCVNDACAPINFGQCESAGNPCVDSGDCCSGLCNDEGYCSIGASYCVQKNDLCTSDGQCCQGVCMMADGASVGYCGILDGGGSNCGSQEGVAGEVCNDNCETCCSRSCAPYSSSGVYVCQPARGCKPDGELCRTAFDCCGGNEDSTLPGAGNATCEKESPDDLVGRCKVTGCNPHGSICGPDDGSGTSCPDTNIPSPDGQSCCDKNLVEGDPCQVDSLLVPRCDVLDACVETGGECATADDCCGGTPCVQDEAGVFRCYDPPGGDCVDEGGPCTADADCCVGTTCLLEPGQVTGVCGSTTDPPGSGGSGMGGGSGTGGSSTDPCAAYGQDCSSADCCNGVPCDGTTNTCRYGGG